MRQRELTSIVKLGPAVLPLMWFIEHVRDGPSEGNGLGKFHFERRKYREVRSKQRLECTYHKVWIRHCLHPYDDLSYVTSSLINLGKVSPDIMAMPYATRKLNCGA